MKGLMTLAAVLAVTSMGSIVRAADLVVDVTGVRGDKGSVALCLWNSAEFFPNCIDHPAYRAVRQPARIGSVPFRLTGVPAGVYAISVYHDEKNIGRLETNLVGMPRQGIGASNDARGRFGPPTFRAASVTVGPDGGTVSLKLVYP